MFFSCIEIIKYFMDCLYIMWIQTKKNYPTVNKALNLQKAHCKLLQTLLLNQQTTAIINFIKVNLKYKSLWNPTLNKMSFSFQKWHCRHQFFHDFPSLSWNSNSNKQKKSKNNQSTGLFLLRDTQNHYWAPPQSNIPSYNVNLAATSRAAKEKVFLAIDMCR